MKKQDFRDFESVVRGIVQAEEDVDRVLKAAKLQRREREGFWSRVEFPELVLGIEIILVVGGMLALVIVSILFS